jgi:hypothetical protein
LHQFAVEDASVLEQEAQLHGIHAHVVV